MTPDFRDILSDVADGLITDQEANLEIKRRLSDKPSNNEFTYIDSKKELAAFAERHGLRHDWHEPDEQGVTAKVVGTLLDNAFGARGHDRYAHNDFYPSSSFSNLFEGHELRVLLIVSDGSDRIIEKAVVNLSNLLAWASDV